MDVGKVLGVLLVVSVALFAVGYNSEERNSTSIPENAAVTFKENTVSRSMPICGSAKRINCVVDGNTIWLDGEKIRLETFNTPEMNGECDRERRLARQATERLRHMLSSEPFMVTRNGTDRYGRTLATISNSSGNVGDVLIAENLAHKWRGYKESWCP